MRPITLIVLLAGFWGVRRLMSYADGRRAQRERDHAETTWEGEGGAVPISVNRTAARVSPESDDGLGDRTRSTVH